MMNYFEEKTAAKNYSLGRPDFHAATIQRFKNFLQLHAKLNKALDIACGTGLSTQALLPVAEDVYGTDLSQEMLSHAMQPDKIKYSVSPAEQQPFANEEFDLITVCSGVHWFDIDKFLFEAHRLLKKNSWLVLYDNFFLARMEGSKDFTDWFNNIYLEKFPSPPRNSNYAWTNENLKEKNFQIIGNEEFTNEVIFTKDQLICYFTTQSNIIAKVESGNADYQSAAIWLTNELEKFFDEDNSARKISFGNWIKYIAKKL